MLGKITGLVAAGLLATSLQVAAVFGQSSIDPQDSLYLQLEIWEAAGLIAALPPYRPLAPSAVIRLLEQVAIKTGPLSFNGRIAQAYLAGFYRAHPGLEFKGRTDFHQTYLQAAAIFWGQGPVLPWLDVSVYGHAWLVGNPEHLVLPAYTYPTEDFIEDDTNLAAAKELNLRLFAFTAIDIRPVPELTLHIGIGRNSIGPFGRNGIVLGPQAPAAGAFVLVYQKDIVTVSMGFFPIVATYDDGTGAVADKYLYYHELTLDISERFRLGILETVVGGGGIRPLYFIPLSVFFFSQGLGGFSDNSQVGLSFQARPIDGLSFKGTWYIDDLHFNDLTSFRFNTKWKFAAQAGVVWVPAATIGSPDLSPLSAIQFDYTAVMPYTYSHYSSLSNGNYNVSAYNYQTYSNRGQNLGPALQPNSDRWNLEFHFKPQADFLVDLAVTLIRHGNASARVAGINTLGHDGSIFDDGYGAAGPSYSPPYPLPSGLPYTRFLTQSVLEHTVQVRLAAQVGLGIIGPPALGTVKAGLAYTFQTIWNRQLVAGQTDSRHFLELTVGYWY